VASGLPVQLGGTAAPATAAASEPTPQLYGVLFALGIVGTMATN
jgi:hypothetical protein